MAVENLAVRIGSVRPVVALAARWLRGAAISQGSGERREVALTFDDGPHPTWTPQILDQLDRGGAKATFFVVGRCAKEHPMVVREMRRRGHDVGTHLYSHDRRTVDSDEWFQRELLQSRAELESLLGEPIHWLRFPYGHRGRQDPRAIETAHGLRTVHWTFSSHDGRLRHPEEIIGRVEAGMRPGAIVLMHDRLADEDSGLPPAYVGPRDATILALPEILQRLRGRDLRAVTLTDLLREGP
jgi:peptidoglycan/xylan/chitin deacetylase (PgdA/CDA1 family)